MKILIAGDFCDIHRVSDCIRFKDYSQLFSDIKNVVQSADYSIVNFEFPVVIGNGSPIPKCGPNLKGQPGAVDAINFAGFNVCTLANNHILDQGFQCCLETKELLEKSHIKTVGIGCNLKDSEKILYLSKGNEKVAIINCAEHEFSYATESTAGANPMNPIRQYHQIREAKQNADYVIVITHGGHEYYNLPSPRMKELYHFFIDIGADAVVNHHQHCFSGYEFYNSKPIFYGIGNLLFDNPNFRNSVWNKGFMVGIDFHEGTMDINTIPYTQCAEDPTVSLLNEQQRYNFMLEIEELNNIIANDELVRSKIEDYYRQNIDNEMDILEPYRGRILNKMLDLGVVPHLIKGSKIPEILNHVHCESHRDKLVYALTHKNI